MSAKHTPGRLTVTHSSWRTSTIYCDGEEVARVHMDSEAHEDDEQHCENARRLAACWNACEGLPTELLESIAMMGDTLASRFKLRDQVERDLAAQRDALLDAQTMGGQLNTPDFLDWIADRLVHVYGEPNGIDFVLSLRECAKAGRSAIAKAIG